MHTILGFLTTYNKVIRIILPDELADDAEMAGMDMVRNRKLYNYGPIRDTFESECR